MKPSDEMVDRDDVSIPIEHNEALTGTLYSPAGPPKAVVQINGGIGVKRHYYRHFASFLASKGYAVLAFDLRGTGASRPRSLKGYTARLRDWGMKDMPAALDWLSARYPDLPSFVVGHSMGGQLTGLMHNHRKLDGIVLVSVATGHFRTFPMPFRLYPMFVLYFFLPLTIPLFGYAPARFVSTGEDLPSGVAWEWISWTRQAGYMKRYLSDLQEAFFYPKITAPILAFAVDDDPMATPEQSRKFLSDYYSSAPSTLTVLRAAAAPKGRVGHLGYFSRSLKNAYWSQVTDWLDLRLAEANPEGRTEGSQPGRRDNLEVA
jgi:predicted alpha/beta hydrolase